VEQHAIPKKPVDLSIVLSTALQVITGPVAFFRGMPKTGGFVQPLIFMAILGAASAVIGLVLSIIGLGSGSVGMAFAGLILTPVMVVIFGFIVAAVIFLIWKIMGSNENYETAFRCVAFISAIAPVTTLFGAIPYLGVLLSLSWTTYLLVVASTEVHGIEQKKALIGFGAIAGILAVISLSTEYAGRKMVKGLEGWQHTMESQNLENMTPEEAGKLVGDFLKGMSQEK
jgi:hypothetical protein